MRRMLGLALFCLAATAAADITPDTFQIEEPFPALTFAHPIQMLEAPDGSNRIFVLERAGRIKVFPKSGSVTPAEVALYLDISARVATQRDFALNSFAFHPDFAANGEVYIHYNWNNGLGVDDLDYGSGRISRIVAANPADNAISSAAMDEEVLYQHRKPKVPELTFPLQDHNGGTIAFGPDGMLYIAFGDGGSTSPQLYANTNPLSFDPLGNAQNTENNLGAIIRIDVDGAPDPGLNYRIPTDNPFYSGGPAGALTRKEIWAYGLRNPWRMAFDNATGDLLAVDVGAKSAEEINLILPGQNYGWRLMEGNSCVPSPPAPDPCVTTGLTPPLVEHIWTTGLYRSLTGGYSYHGSAATQLDGRFIYADYVDGGIFAMKRDGSAATTLRLLDTAHLIAGFGQDQSGEVYILSYSATGRIWRLKADPAVYPSASPATENATEIVALNGQLVATDVGGVTSYEIVGQPASGTLNLAVATGAYTYTPNNLAANTVDTFTFRALDAQSNESNLATITINIAAANDAPAIAGTLAATLPGGDTTLTITTTTLEGTDPDSPAASVVFRVGTAPAHGTINVSGTPATQFTRADLAASLVTYAFTGNSNVTSGDAFALTVEDESAVASAPSTVSITILDINDAPSITGTLAATLPIGDTILPIAAALGATDPDSPAANVLFRVSAAPAHGTVNVSGVPATQFTQADLAASRVTYVFTGNAALVLGDTFGVTVEDESAVASAPSAFTVTIEQPTTPVDDWKVL